MTSTDINSQHGSDKGTEMSNEPMTGKETMWAIVHRDEYTGEIVWLTQEADSRDPPDTLQSVALLAEAFPIGTRLSIIEPSSPHTLTNEDRG